jgi:ADP-glucose pyrophosphorylase
MKERLIDRIRRAIREARDKRYKRIIRKYVEKHDKIGNYAFMAYSWGVDEITDYHVVAERSYPDHRVYGTEVTWYNKEV